MNQELKAEEEEAHPLVGEGTSVERHHMELMAIGTNITTNGIGSGTGIGSVLAMWRGHLDGAACHQCIIEVGLQRVGAEIA